MPCPQCVSRQISKPPSLGIYIKIFRNKGSFVVYFLIRGILNIKIFQRNIPYTESIFILFISCDNDRYLCIIRINITYVNSIYFAFLIELFFIGTTCFFLPNSTAFADSLSTVLALFRLHNLINTGQVTLSI